MNYPKTAILIPYFGRWPDWIELFFESVSRNSEFDFILYSDCETNFDLPANVVLKKTTFNEYINHIQIKLDFPINIPNPYKICDLRPLFGFLHEEEFKDYDFYGWCDIDLVFGKISDFLTLDLFNSYDVFSTHAHTISGHFALFRNNARNKEMYKKIYDFKGALNNPNFVGIDEHGLSNAYKLSILDKFNLKFKKNILKNLALKINKLKTKNIYFKEQFTTPLLNKPWIDGTLNDEQPSVWYWIEGDVTNNKDDRKFMYLHFMNFRSSQWRMNKTEAPWEKLNKITQVSVVEMKQYGLQIDFSGIHKVEQTN